MRKYQKSKKKKKESNEFKIEISFWVMDLKIDRLDIDWSLIGKN